MPKWLVYSTISMLIWATWSLLSPIASAGLSGGMIQLLSSAGLIPVALLLLLSKNIRSNTHIGKGLPLALATGILAGVGNIMVYRALENGGPVSVVFPISSLAPLVPVLAAPVLFQERIRAIQLGAVAVSLLAIVLLNTTPSTGAAIASARLGSSWMMYALLSVVIYGITYLPQKAATYFISDELSTVAFAAGYLVLDVVLLLTDGSLTTNIPVIAGTVSVVIGILTGFGSLTLFQAYRRGKASIVTPYVQLFPVFSVVIGVPLYGERVDLTRGIGILLAITAGVVLSLEKDESSRIDQLARE